MRIALVYKRVNISESSLLDQVGYDSTPLDVNNNIWGNPNRGFVGTLSGQPKGNGCGAHWDPVAKAAANHRPVEVKTGWNTQGIAQELAKGNPIVVWWVNGIWPSYERFWKTTDGETIRAVNAMHTVDNPKTFIVQDPWWSRKEYPSSLFSSYWKWFNNTAIIVRSHPNRQIQIFIKDCRLVVLFNILINFKTVWILINISILVPHHQSHTFQIANYLLHRSPSSVQFIYIEIFARWHPI